MIAAVVLTHFWREKPSSHSSRHAYLGASLTTASPIPDWNVGKAVDAYLREPTDDCAALVWESFGNLDVRILSLKEQAARTVGGLRAEAEVERIELERLRDEQMPRFLSARARWKSAQAAFDALSASIDGRDGVENAAAILIHGRKRDLEAANRVSGRP